MLTDDQMVINDSDPGGFFYGDNLFVRDTTNKVTFYISKDKSIEELNTPFYAENTNQDKEEERKQKLVHAIINASSSMHDIPLQFNAIVEQKRKMLEQEIEDIREIVLKTNWEDLIQQREAAIRKQSKSVGRCILCRKNCYPNQLYLIKNRIIAPDDIFPHFEFHAVCYDCLEPAYNLLFPLCVSCNSRYAPMDKNDLRGYCRPCRSGPRYQERSRVKLHVERARACNVAMSLTIDEWLATLDFFKWSCAYCNGGFEVLEHYVPLPHGGTTSDNCIPACQVCNAKKKNKHPDKLHKIFNLDNLDRIKGYLTK